jgi:hypothetical protein
MELGNRVEPHESRSKPTKNEAHRARRPKQGPRQLMHAEDGDEPEGGNGCPAKHAATMGDPRGERNRLLVPVAAIERLPKGTLPHETFQQGVVELAWVVGHIQDACPSNVPCVGDDLDHRAIR